MTVDELIAKLAVYPGDYQVLANKDEFAGGPLGSRFKGDGTKCHCEDFKDNKGIGEPCICNLYVKVAK